MFGAVEAIAAAPERNGFRLIRPTPAVIDGGRRLMRQPEDIPL
jgi:hypothetical protein